MISTSEAEEHDEEHGEERPDDAGDSGASGDERCAASDDGDGDGLHQRGGGGGAVGAEPRASSRGDEFKPNFFFNNKTKIKYENSNQLNRIQCYFN